MQIRDCRRTKVGDAADSQDGVFWRFHSRKNRFNTLFTERRVPLHPGFAQVSPFVARAQPIREPIHSGVSDFVATVAHN